jgi:hypothetical protein
MSRPPIAVHFLVFPTPPSVQRNGEIFSPFALWFSVARQSAYGPLNGISIHGRDAGQERLMRKMQGRHGRAASPVNTLNPCGPYGRSLVPSDWIGQRDLDRDDSVGRLDPGECAAPKRDQLPRTGSLLPQEGRKL